MRFFLKLFVLALGLPALYFTWTAADIWQISGRDERPRSDAIVVLGAAQYDGNPSPVFRLRLDHARSLYRSGVAPLVFVLGGKREGDRFTEAQAGAAYLEQVLPARRVIGVGVGHSTLESLEAFSVQAADRDIRRVVLVSDRLHLARAGEIAEDLGLQAAVSAPRSHPRPGASRLSLAREVLVLTYYRVFGRG